MRNAILRLFLAGLAAAFILPPSPVTAAKILVTYTGVLTSGVDTPGVFGTPGSDLSGNEFTAKYILDTSTAAPVLDRPGDRSLSCFALAGCNERPISGSVTISGSTQDFSGNFNGEVRKINDLGYVDELRYLVYDRGFMGNTDFLMESVVSSSTHNIFDKTDFGESFRYITQPGDGTSFYLAFASRTLDRSLTQAFGTINSVSTAPLGQDGKPLVTPPAAPPPPISYSLPLKTSAPPLTGKDLYEVSTEPGGACGKDCVPDEFHKKNMAYYALDIRVNVQPGQKAEVVAAAPGRVVYICRLASCDGGLGPVMIVYNGNGYYSEYREFTQKSDAVVVGQFVSTGQKIASYVKGDTGDGARSLHFQVKYDHKSNYHPSCSIASCPPADEIIANGRFRETGLSTLVPDIPELRGVTLNGQRIGDYRLAHPIPGTLTSTNMMLTSPLLDTFNTFDATIAGSTAALVEHSPAYLWKDVFIPANANYLGFEFNWINKGDGDYLTVFLGDKLLFTSVGTDFTATDFINSGLLSIGDFAGQNRQLLYWLNSVGAPNAQLQIRGLTFYGGTSVPEPAIWALMIAGFGMLGGAMRRRSQAELVIT